MQPDSEVIDHLVRSIVEAVHPLRILLFGSAVRGEMSPNSDIDVLVVMPEGIHRRRTAQFLYRRIRGLGVPFDILVATPITALVSVRLVQIAEKIETIERSNQ